MYCAFACLLLLHVPGSFVKTQMSDSSYWHHVFWSHTGIPFFTVCYRHRPQQVAQNHQIGTAISHVVYGLSDPYHILCHPHPSSSVPVSILKSSRRQCPMLCLFPNHPPNKPIPGGGKGSSLLSRLVHKVVYHIPPCLLSHHHLNF